MNYDIAYCASTDCKYSDCIRHQSHVPAGVPVAMCYFDCPYERETGEWLDDQYFWRCSQCLEWLEVKQGTADMNYCPHCGAKMDETDINVGDKEG